MTYRNCGAEILRMDSFHVCISEYVNLVLTDLCDFSGFGEFSFYSVVMVGWFVGQVFLYIY
jgi:hypothetical protein